MMKKLIYMMSMMMKMTAKKNKNIRIKFFLVVKCFNNFNYLLFL
jgi:hypothetical protein